MAKTLEKSIELARWFDSEGKEKKITIQKYLDLESAKNRAEIAEFLYQRLYSRYLKPFMFNNSKFTKEYKNGFSIMANCCLFIETLQSFKNGWGDSDGKSEKAIKQFLREELNFSSEFTGKGKAFYKNVRCGILHQGETTGGWAIHRSGKGPLFNAKTLKIDSILFITKLEKALDNYSSKLKTEAWESDTWKCFRDKMKKIISNCEK